MPFGNSLQYTTLLSISSDSDYATLGCAQCNGNTALAFQDMRIFTSALTAEDAAAYAVLYPTTLPAFTENLDQYAYVQSYGADGTIRIREGGKWHLAYYCNNGIAHLSVKNLILDGSVTREKDTFTLDVTGSITGNGTTPMLKMGADAVFKPTGTGYLTITESLSGTMTIDLSGLELPAGSIPLFKVGSAAMLPAENEIAFAAGFDTKGWRLRKTSDGLGYDLARVGFTILIR